MGRETIKFEGFSYRRDNILPNGTKYWRCSSYSKTTCRARISSRVVNGYEMVKIQKDVHNHEMDWDDSLAIVLD